MRFQSICLHDGQLIYNDYLSLNSGTHLAYIEVESEGDMTRTELKKKAQAEILNVAMQSMFRTADMNLDGLNDKDMITLTDEMDKQLRRIEKMFGYVPGSWRRGA